MKIDISYQVQILSGSNINKFVQFQNLQKHGFFEKFFNYLKFVFS